GMQDRLIHDPLLTDLHVRLSDARADVVEHLVPRDTLPASAAARPDPAQRILDPLRIGHLVQGRRPLGAIAPAAAGMDGIAFKFLDRESLAVDVREKPAAGLAVEADRRDQR